MGLFCQASPTMKTATKYIARPRMNQHILNGIESNKCYYLICAEVDGTWINYYDDDDNKKYDINDMKQEMTSKLLVMSL